MIEVNIFMELLTLIYISGILFLSLKNPDKKSKSREKYFHGPFLTFVPWSKTPIVIQSMNLLEKL